MPKRTTIEIDTTLLERAKRALGQDTIRGTVEEALRRATDDAEQERAARARKELQFFDALPDHVDVDALMSNEMWR